MKHFRVRKRDIISRSFLYLLLLSLLLILYIITIYSLEYINVCFPTFLLFYFLSIITKEDLEANPHMKFATGETDTGVIISWHAEGPKNVEANAPIPNVIIAKNGIAINPLNWKLDETYAPASENLGSIVGDEKTGKTEIRDIDGDAQVCLARGTVVTNAKAVPNEMTDLAGPQCYHQDDYAIFYNNIKDNVAKRIAAYKAK